jgi:hypothetical protein
VALFKVPAGAWRDAEICDLNCHCSTDGKKAEASDAITIGKLSPDLDLAKENIREKHIRSAGLQPDVRLKPNLHLSHPFRGFTALGWSADSGPYSLPVLNRFTSAIFADQISACQSHVGSAIADRAPRDRARASRLGASDGPQIADPTACPS